MKWLKSKTIWTAILVTITGLVQTFVDDGIFTAKVSGIVLMIIGLLQMVLRSVTTKPLSEK